MNINRSISRVPLWLRITGLVAAVLGAAVAGIHHAAFSTDPQSLADYLDDHGL